MDESKKPQTTAKSEKPEKKDEDRMLVTRAILNEVRQALGYDWRYTNEEMLAHMRQMIGRPIELVDKVPDDEEIVVLCALEPAVPGSLTDQCSECGVTVYHSRNAPPNSRKICTRCGPPLGQ